MSTPSQVVNTLLTPNEEALLQMATPAIEAFVDSMCFIGTGEDRSLRPLGDIPPVEAVIKAYFFKYRHVSPRAGLFLRIEEIIRLHYSTLSRDTW